MAEVFYFDGFETPHGTYVPDCVFDELAPQLKESELRVLLYIIRRTFGFKKQTDTISLKQMTEGIKTREGKVLDQGTGLSKSANARGVHGLVEKGVITVQRNRSIQRGDEATTYALRFKDTPVSSKKTPPCPPRRHPRVLQEDTKQQTVEQATEQQQVVAHLMKWRVSPKKASHLAQLYDSEFIEQKVELLGWKLGAPGQGTTIKDATAWLINAIEQDYQPPPTFKTAKERQAAATHKVQRQAAIDRQHEEQRQRDDMERQRRRKAAWVELREHYHTTGKEDALWGRVLAKLKSRLDEPLLAETQLLALNADTLTLGVVNQFVRARVETQLAPHIIRAVQDVLDIPGTLCIQVVVLKDNHPAEPVSSGG